MKLEAGVEHDQTSFINVFFSFSEKIMDKDIFPMDFDFRYESLLIHVQLKHVTCTISYPLQLGRKTNTDITQSLPIKQIKETRKDIST